MNIASITSRQIERGESGSSDNFHFLGLQNHFGQWPQLWNWKSLALGRKGTTNLDSTLKSRDITLLTMVHTVRAMVFPLDMYECESWIIKKAECWRIGAFELWYWRIPSRVPWAARSHQSILKEINPEYSLEGLMLKLKLQYFEDPMQTANSLEKTLMLRKIKGKRWRRRLKMRWLSGNTDSIDKNLSNLGSSEGPETLACCSPWGLKRIRHDLVTGQQQHKQKYRTKCVIWKNTSAKKCYWNTHTMIPGKVLLYRIIQKTSYSAARPLLLFPPSSFNITLKSILLKIFHGTQLRKIYVKCF